MVACTKLPWLACGWDVAVPKAEAKTNDVRNFTASNPISYSARTTQPESVCSAVQPLLTMNASKTLVVDNGTGVSECSSNTMIPHSAFFPPIRPHALSHLSLRPLLSISPFYPSSINTQVYKLARLIPSLH